MGFFHKYFKIVQKYNVPESCEQAQGCTMEPPATTYYWCSSAIGNNRRMTYADWKIFSYWWQTCATAIETMTHLSLCPVPLVLCCTLGDLMAVTLVLASNNIVYAIVIIKRIRSIRKYIQEWKYFSHAVSINLRIPKATQRAVLHKNIVSTSRAVHYLFGYILHSIGD